MTAPVARPRRITGRMVLIGMVVFFGVVVAVNGVFLYLALRSFPGLESETPYRKGLAHDEELKAERAQQALGWRVTLAWQGAGPAQGRLEVSLADAAGQPLSARAVRLFLRRPVHAADDIHLPLAERAPGHYSADVILPGAGNWEAIVTIARPGAADYRHRQRIIVP